MDQFKGPNSSKILNQQEEKEMRNRIKGKIVEMSSIRCKVLIWGTSPTTLSEISSLQIKMREELESRGYQALLSEELMGKKSKWGISLQELIYVQEFDLIVSMPTSFEAIAAIKDLIGDGRVNRRIMIFFDETLEYGYSFQSLLVNTNQLACSVIPYKGKVEFHKIEEEVYKLITRIRDTRYLNQQR